MTTIRYEIRALAPRTPQWAARLGPSGTVETVPEIIPDGYVAVRVRGRGDVDYRVGQGPWASSPIEAMGG